MNRHTKGVALLMVLSAIVILALVLVEFGVSARTHLTTGVNLRDDARATTMADTALVLSRACLDPRAWGPMASFQSKVDSQKLCNLLLDIFVSGRVDLPVGGLSVELEGIEGVGLGTGEIEDIELTPESSYIGLRGLWCQPDERRPDEQQIDCQTRKSAVLKLRALLCDPAIAHVFEHEQADGHKYQREEVIGNLIDWVDADDDRVSVIFAPQLLIEQDGGEGEDSYLRDKDRRYRSKDAPFDSVHELKMVRGINDELFEYLRDKISVHGDERININGAGVEVIAALLAAQSPVAQAMEGATCGEEVAGGLDPKPLFTKWARLIDEYRKLKASQPASLLSPPFRNARDFVRVAGDPIAAMEGIIGQEAGAGVGIRELILERAQLHVQVTYDEEGRIKDQLVLGEPLQVYEAMKQEVAKSAQGMQKSIKTDTKLYRLRVKGRVGNMTRSLFAILKKDKLDADSDAARDKEKKVKPSKSNPLAGLPVPQGGGALANALGGGSNQVIIRTLYYREE